MPNISITLVETDQSITRPIVFDIIDQLQDITKITKDSKIFYPGDTNRVQTPGSDIDSKTDRTAIFSTNRISFIEVNEEYDKDYLATTSVSNKNHVPIFLDEKLGVSIAPIYSTNKLTINYKYKTSSKSEAARWRDDFRFRISQLRDINLHHVTYHYDIPLEFLLVLKMIYNNREGNLGYGQEFREYVTSYSSPNLTLVSDMVGSDSRLVIRETQGRVIGRFDVDDIPDKPERDETDGTWSISFNYVINYDKVIGCNMKYPVIVHNKLLPLNIIEFVNRSINIDKQLKSSPTYTQALSDFESDSIMNSIKSPDQVLKIPYFDDFIIPSTPSYTATVFMALSIVENDNRTLINLNELDDLMLDTDILNYIKEVEYPYLGRLYHSPFHVTLYRDGFLGREDSLICDSNLNIVATKDLDLRRQHRVRFSIIDNLPLLNKDFFVRVRSYPKVLLKYLTAVYDILRLHPDFVDLSKYDRISNVDWNNLMNLLAGLGYVGSKPSGSFYITGNQGNNWPYKPNPNNRGLFLGINPMVLNSYKQNNVNMRTVQLTGVVATTKDNVRKIIEGKYGNS